ncbi:family 43 glycosylhydrolase [Paenibacillus swuensis]|nr:family 43 glycosylhydrolase [Paenibacillus swuensis]
MNNQETGAAQSEYNGHGGTFKNTLSPMDTPDPSVVYKDGYYYMTFTHNGTDIMVLKSRTIDFKQAQRKIVWLPDVGTAYSAELWAPEIQWIQGKWYIYFAADDGLNENHRMFALQADTEDPMGAYTFKGQIGDASDKWAIDGLVMEYKEKLYFVWSGWEGDVNERQNTYIAPMSDPLTISGERVRLSTPDMDWEQAGGPPFIQEGQSILHHEDRVHIVYSGAGSWTPYYSLGMLSLKENGDPLSAADWVKAEKPLMTMNAKASVYGPGHNSFTSSPDGRELWIVYHATSREDDGWNNRKARAAKVTWDENGNPLFGEPLSLRTAIHVPSGTGLYRPVAQEESPETLVIESVPSSVETNISTLIHYTNNTGKDALLNVGIQDQPFAQVSLPSVETDGKGFAYVSVKMGNGLNDLILDGLPAGVKVEAVEFPRYEAEDAQGKGDAETEENPYASGTGIAVLPADKASSINFSNVCVPVAGTYVLRIAAANSSGGKANVQVSVNGKDYELNLQSTKRNQHLIHELEVELNSGPNEIILEHAKHSVHMDYMDVSK